MGKYTYTISNMKLSLPELIPENIHLKLAFDMEANPLELQTHDMHTYLYIQAYDFCVFTVLYTVLIYPMQEPYPTSFARLLFFLREINRT